MSEDLEGVTACLMLLDEETAAFVVVVVALVDVLAMVLGLVKTLEKIIIRAELTRKCCSTLYMIRLRESCTV